MDFKLPKTDEEYKEDLRNEWGVDIDKDFIIGTYSRSSKNPNLGFFNSCKNEQGRFLKHPIFNDKNSISIKIEGNHSKLIPHKLYKFRVKFAQLGFRLQRDHYGLNALANSAEPPYSTKVISNTSDNSKSNLQNIIKEIYSEKLNQNSPYNIIDLAEAVNALAIDIYSENKRFIYELIQNADDAALVDNSDLEIAIRNEYLIIAHNGKPFDEKDLRGLCGIGRGTKRGDGNKTGYKGIGFKSVFGQPEGIVYVKTKELVFKFDRDVVHEKGWNQQKWGNRKEWEEKNGIPFNVPWQLIPLLTNKTSQEPITHILDEFEQTILTIIKISDREDLESDINNLLDNGLILLFLRRIKNIKFTSDNYNLSINKTPYSDNDFYSLNKNNNFLSNWYISSGKYDVPKDVKIKLTSDTKSPKKLQEVNVTELSFAIKLNKDFTKIKALKDKDSLIYTYLPTEVTDFQFPFLVNSNFLVDAGREKLHRDRIWNKWLFKIIGYKLLPICSKFSSLEQYVNQYLSMLVTSYYESDDPLKIGFNEGLRIGFEETHFIPNRNGELIKLDEALIDETKFTESPLAPITPLVEWINKNSEVQFEEKNIILPHTGYTKLKSFNVSTFKQEKLKDFFTSEDFQNTISISNNVSLIKYLKNLDSSDKTGEWGHIIKNQTFIFSSKEELEKIPLVCFPIGEFETSFGGDSTLMHSDKP